MKISIIGTGIYGIALALKAANLNHNITMWTENKELYDNFKKNHDFKSIIDRKIPKNINLTTDLEKSIKDTDLIIIATAAKYFRSICDSLKPIYNKSIPICIASKGIENDTYCLLSSIASNILNTKHISVISGPTFAVDLINNDPCAFTLATTSKKTEKVVKMALKSSTLKLRTNIDIDGTEICGSIKNVLAIAAGILDGLGYSESTRAFFLTEAIHDMKELLKKLGCKEKTILSYAGIGDLILTCSTPKSRNYKFGTIVGSKASKKEIENYLKNTTTEGYYTLLSIKGLVKNKKIRIPIINIIYDICINYEDPEILPKFLINKN